MASECKIAMNRKRRKLVEQYAKRRAELKEIVRNPNSTPEEREAAVFKLQKLPRNASPVRIVNRCEITGRPRAYYRDFGLARNKFRELALSGWLPGVTKSSW